MGKAEKESNMFNLEIRGNIGGELKTVPNKSGGVSYAFSVCQRVKKGEQGQWVTAFLNESRGKSLAQYLVKGQEVFLRGPMRAKVFTNAKTGESTVDMSINVDTLELLGGKPETKPQAGAQGFTTDDFM